MSTATISLDIGLLDARQRAAVTAPPGPLLVVAGPGTGKTTVLAWRIAHLIAAQGVDPRAVLGVTFTNRAARELKERVSALCPLAAPATIGTLHAFGFGLLRRWADRLGYDPRHLTVLDRDEQLDVVRSVLAEDQLGEDDWPAEEVRDAISVRKRADARCEPDETFAAVAQEIATAYRRHNWLDFDDLVALPLALLRQDPRVLRAARDRFSAIVVDEAQDLDDAQYRLLSLLAGRDGPITLVGDPLQTIFAWRGAALPTIEDLRSDFPALRVVELERSYRSTATILEAAAAVGALVATGHRPLRTERGDGQPITVALAPTQIHEATFVADEIARLHAGGVARWRDCVVLYRSRWQGDAIAQTLGGRGIPVWRADGADFLRIREMSDLLAYLRCAVNPADLHALARAINHPPRGLASLERALRGHQLGSLEDLARRGPGLLGRKAARDRLAGFLALRAELADLAACRPPAEVLAIAIERSGYRDWLGGQKGGPRRLQLVDRLVAMVDARDATDLPSLLAEVAGAERESDLPAGDAVVLSTIHRAKGQEFAAVFVVGLAEGLLPHRHALAEPARLAEEGRLAYVALTRARDRLILTVPLEGERDGESFFRATSSFLDVLPQHLLRVVPR